MKLFKKLLSYIIAVTMVLSLATLLGGNVHAADTAQPVITINNAPSGRKYKAYQIFKGDYSKGTLSNIEWGDNVDLTKLLPKLVADTHNFNGINTDSSAKTVAEKLNPGIDTDQAKAFAKYAEASKTGDGFESTENTKTKTTTITVTGSGYYLVEDITVASNQASKNESYTRYIVKVVGGNTDINLKGNVPTVVKKVQDANDSTDTSTTTKKWQDSADYDIGDEVPYQITGTMPANIADYTSYKYIFTDTMSKGLTYTKKTATIKIGDTDVTSSFTENVTTNDDGSTVVTWTCNNLKNKEDKEDNKLKDITLTKDSTVVVTYSAKLNESAVIGATGNPNTVDLTYSNNPNKGGDGETGKTPEDKNIVFTYKTVVNKLDQDNKPLAGADFTLYKFVRGTGTDSYKEGNNTYYGTWTDVTTLRKNGNNPKKNITAYSNDKGEADNAKFSFEGIDDGYYKLVESNTPAGYNTINPIEFKISATHDETKDEPTLLTLSGNATIGEATFTADQAACSLTTDVVNQKGSTLPSTGGMGTTLLYVAGGILVACAAAYVVLNKKRA